MYENNMRRSSLQGNDDFLHEYMLVLIEHLC